MSTQLANLQTTNNTSGIEALKLRLKQIAELWTLILGFCPPPLPHILTSWLRQFSDDEIQFAFERTAGKFYRECPEPEMVHRYVTGVLVNARERGRSGRMETR